MTLAPARAICTTAAAPSPGSKTSRSASASTGSRGRRTTLFEQLRGECPVHWTERITEYPEEAGYWSVTTRRRRPRRQPRLEDVLLGARRHHRGHRGCSRSSSCGRCSSGWIRPSTTASRRCSRPGSRRKRIADARGRDPQDRHRRARPARGPRDLRPRRSTSPSPSSSRVIGSFMGIPPEDDAAWAALMNSALGAGDPDLNPDGVESVAERDIPEIFERCRRMIAERREHPDRRPDERARPRRDRRPEARGARDRDGLLPAGRGRQRQHQGDLLQRDAGAAASIPISASCCSTIRR